MNTKKVNHIALIKFKPETTQAQIKQIFDEIGALKNLIPGILSYEWGMYSSPEGMNQGYTHAFITTFDCAESRDVYLPHPEHERVKDLALPKVEAVVVFDFEV